MRAGDVLSSLGRPVTFHASLARTLGSIPAALMLGQLLYWTGKERDGNGWLYKVEEDWEAELALGARQVKNARALLVDLGLVEHARRGMPAMPYYRVDIDALEAWWGSNMTGPKSRTRQHEEAGQDSTKGPVTPMQSTDDSIDDSHRARPPMAALAAFEEWWAVYPHKAGKGAARKAWDKVAGRRVSVAKLIEAAARYRDDPNRDPAFTCYPATWLNQERWDDQPLPPRSRGNGSVGSRNVANVQSMHRRTLGPPPSLLDDRQVMIGEG